MAIIVDAARNVDKAVNRAAAAFTQPTSAISYTQDFTIEQSVVESRVPTWVTDGSITPPTPTPQSALPIVKYADFYLAKVVGTERFT